MKLGLNKRAFKILVIIILIVVGCFVLNFFLPKLTGEEAREFVRGLGFWGPLVVMIYIVFSHVVAPITGTPMMVLSIALFGMYEAMVYFYLASLMSATINFYISRKFGRAWVLKLAGRKNMDRVDGFVEYAGIELLVLSRIFGFTIFDVISYAAGLTMISFWKYFIITLVCTIPARVIFAYAFRGVDFGTLYGVAIWIGTLVIFAILFSLFLKIYLNKKRRLDDCG